jgi:hypothetical protein
LDWKRSPTYRTIFSRRSTPLNVRVSVNYDRMAFKHSFARKPIIALLGASRLSTGSLRNDCFPAKEEVRTG